MEQVHAIELDWAEDKSMPMLSFFIFSIDGRLFIVSYAWEQD